MTDGQEALDRLLSQDAHSISEDEERPGSIFHYHLPEGREITVYPLMFGDARLCTGRIDRDHWDKAFDYHSAEEAIEAAEGWIDTDKPPSGDYYKEH